MNNSFLSNPLYILKSLIKAIISPFERLSTENHYPFELIPCNPPTCFNIESSNVKNMLHCIKVSINLDNKVLQGHHPGDNELTIGVKINFSYLTKGMFRKIA